MIRPCGYTGRVHPTAGFPLRRLQVLIRGAHPTTARRRGVTAIANQWERSGRHNTLENIHHDAGDVVWDSGVGTRECLRRECKGLDYD